jgi:predicted flavoprotein YhiN
LAGLTACGVEEQGAEETWALTADVIIAGAGTSGLSAAIEARDHGASVIIVEANYDCGGHGLVSGGRVNLGGGTSRQRRQGVDVRSALRSFFSCALFLLPYIITCV